MCEFIRKAYELLEIDEGDKVVELGFGTGQFVIYGVCRVNTSFVGIELNSLLCAVSKLNMLFVRQKGSAVLMRGSYDDTNWGQFQKVFMFSMHSEITRIRPKLERELEQGARVVSVMFPIPSKKFRELARYGDGSYRLFLYERIN